MRNHPRLALGARGNRRARCVALGAVTAIAGYTLVEWFPESLLQLIVGTLLLVFGLQWLRKAILRVLGTEGNARRGGDASRGNRGRGPRCPRRPGSGSTGSGSSSRFKGVFLEGSRDRLHRDHASGSTQTTSRWPPPGLVRRRRRAGGRRRAAPAAQRAFRRTRSSSPSASCSRHSARSGRWRDSGVFSRRLAGASTCAGAATSALLRGCSAGDLVPVLRGMTRSASMRGVQAASRMSDVPALLVRLHRRRRTGCIAAGVRSSSSGSTRTLVAGYRSVRHDRGLHRRGSGSWPSSSANYSWDGKENPPLLRRVVGTHDHTGAQWVYRHIDTRQETQRLETT